jgi:hypothetical protein
LAEYLLPTAASDGGSGAPGGQFLANGSAARRGGRIEPT